MIFGYQYFWESIEDVKSRAVGKVLGDQMGNKGNVTAVV